MFYKKKYLEAQHKLDQANTEILELKTHCEAFEYACYVNFIKHHTLADMNALKKHACYNPAYWSDTLKLSSLLCNSFIKEFDDDIEP